LAAKIDDINKLRNRSWTDAELDEKLNRERTLRNKYTPTDRNRVLKLIEEAKQRGDTAKVAELQDELDTVETPRLAWKTSLTTNKKPASTGLSQQDRLAQLNIENRRRNAEAVRKAQLKEKAKSRDIEGRIARGEDVSEDTSRRLRTQPKFMQDANASGADRKSTPGNGSGATTPANGTPKLGASKASLPAHIAKLQQQSHASVDKKGLPQFHRPLVDDDIIGALDLDIDVEID
jgi:RNA polymerase-associated protein RTF1